MPKWLHALALTVVAAGGLLLAARAWIGPFWIVNSPINLEGLVAVFFVLGLSGLSTRLVWPQTLQNPTREILCVASLLAIIMGVFWKSLWFPLLSDDYILVTHAASPAGSLLAPFITAGGDGSYRPIGYLALLASSKWAAIDPFRWHVISLAVHAANAVFLYIAVRMAAKSTDIALPAAAIFALHGTRPEAVTWTAGRFDVLAGFFALAALIVFLRYYDLGKPSYAIASGFLVAIAIMCKESAYGFPALAIAFCAVSGCWKWRRLATVLVVPTAMLAYRFSLFHGPGGYIDAHTGRAQILSIRFLPALKAFFLRFWAIMVFPIDWAEKPGFYVALSLTCMIGCLIVLCLKPGRVALILAACTMLAALPAIHLLAIGPDLLGARILYLPAVAFALLMSVAIAAIERRALSRCIAGFVIIFYAAGLLHNLAIWGRVANLADRTCVAAAPKLAGATGAAILGIPIAIDGVNFFANGFAQCVELHSDSPPRNWTITHLPGSKPATPNSRTLEWDDLSQTLR